MGIPSPLNQGRFQYSAGGHAGGMIRQAQAWIPELGMYYYKARIYLPTLGRFLQTDPIGYEDQINLYAYVGNDPVNMVDPDGKESGSVVYNSIVSLTEARAADHDPQRARVEKQALVVGVSIISAGRVIGSIIRFATRSSATQNTTKAGTQATERPKGVPENFKPSPAEKGGGMKYTDPANPHNNVRDMPGNPNSPNPSQQNPYVKENVSGQPIDVAGRPVSGKSPESHIPWEQYQGKVRPDE